LRNSASVGGGQHCSIFIECRLLHVVSVEEGRVVLKAATRQLPCALAIAVVAGPEDCLAAARHCRRGRVGASVLFLACCDASSCCN